MEDNEVTYMYGTLDDYNALAEKDESCLYFLDNSSVYKGTELLGCVHTVSGSFPAAPTSDMRRNYYISLESGLIKYVNDDLSYVDISSLMIRGVVLNSSFIQEFISKLKSKEITMPKVSVDGHVICFTSSNIEKITVLTNELN